MLSATCSRSSRVLRHSAAVPLIATRSFCARSFLCAHPDRPNLKQQLFLATQHHGEAATAEAPAGGSQPAIHLSAKAHVAPSHGIVDKHHVIAVAVAGEEPLLGGRRSPVRPTLPPSPVSKPPAPWRSRQRQQARQQHRLQKQLQQQRTPPPPTPAAAAEPTAGAPGTASAVPPPAAGAALHGAATPPPPTATTAEAGADEPEATAAAATAGTLVPGVVNQMRPRPGPQAAAAAAGGAQVQLTPAHMSERAASNQALASAALAAAAAAGRQPLLRELLVEPSWVEVLGGEFDKPYMTSLQAFLERECAQAGPGQQVFPAQSDIFRAFNSVPFDQVRVVILGQDPYPQPGNAMGLSFSVTPGVRPPRSLANIYKELEADCGVSRSSSGDLTPWCHQGVLLLNAILTVRQADAGSHAGQGWEVFTDTAMAALSTRRQDVVFLLWGKVAQAKGAALDTTRHHVLTAAHPASRSGGFFECKHFSQANQLLQQSGQRAIDWRVG